MINTFETYLIKIFLKKILNISLIFLSLVFIISIFEEISFFKELKVNIFFPFITTALTTPSTLFEIFPFIFLISTQFLFLDLIDRGELEMFKVHGLDNFKIIKMLFLTSFITGILLVSLYYNFSSKLEFLYLELKNKYSNDNKYLAVVTENGLWIKDEIEQKIYITNAHKIEDHFLLGVSISHFDNNFDLIQIIDSPKVDISNLEWVIFKPTISIENKSLEFKQSIKIDTHFNKKKINSLFTNLSSLNIFELIKLNKDYKTLGYSTNEVVLHLNRLFSFPLFISLMSIFASIIMFNIKRNKPKIFHIILGIFLSVLIYYFYYLFNLMGENGKIPLFASVWLPLLIITFFIFIGLVRINEK